MQTDNKNTPAQIWFRSLNRYELPKVCIRNKVKDGQVTDEEIEKIYLAEHPQTTKGETAAFDPFSNLSEQIVNISKAGAYDVIVKQRDELMEENTKLKEALQGIIDNWDERMGGDVETEKENTQIKPFFKYWSPSASMVSSEFIANARKVLSKAKEALK